MIDQDIWKNVGVAVTKVMDTKHDDWDILKGEDLGDTIKVTCLVRVTDTKNKRVKVMLPSEMFR